MATIKELKELALHAARGTAPANFSAETVDEALRAELTAMASSVNDFQRNKYDIFDIIIETIDEVVPKRVIGALDAFAEIRVVPQGQKAIFKQKVGKQRAKKFLTRVGLSGVYETFRLDVKEFEVNVDAMGIGATLDFERLLDGSEALADTMEAITEAFEDGVFYKVQRALRAALNAGTRPTANKVINAGFDGDKMAKLCAVVRAYGGSAIILAPPEFVAAMGADAIVPGFVYPAAPGTPQTGVQGVYSPDDIEAIHRTGYVNIFRGVPVVQIPQSYTDENNNTTYIDPQLAYVLPTGGEKPVKVVLEGDTQMWDWVNKDQSIEIMAYKKIGVAILAQHNWGIYQNSSITQTYAETLTDL